MRLPDLRSATIDGVPFVDAGGRAQSRYIGELQNAHKAKLAESDPIALSKSERERLDAAEARLAEAMAAHESAVATWTDLKVRRWQGQHETSLVNGIKQKVTRSLPSEAEIGNATLAKEAAEHELQQTLIWRTKEMQAVAAAQLGPKVPGRGVDQVTARWDVHPHGPGVLAGFAVGSPALQPRSTPRSAACWSVRSQPLPGDGDGNPSSMGTDGPRSGHSAGGMKSSATPLPRT